MSQALEDFKNHQFHTNWQYLKNEVYSKYKPEEISDTTELESYSVINKQLEFIDNWLKLIDPELVDTVAVLNNINSRIIKITNNVAHYQHKTQYIAMVSGRVVTNIEQTKNYLADCIKEIIKLPIVIPKITSHSITRMLNNYRDTIQQALAEINLEKTKKDASDIKNYKQELIDNENSISKTIDNEYKKINHFYNELLVDEQNKISTKQQVVNGKNEILEHIKQIKEQHSEFNTKLDEFKNYYVQIFGSYNDETKTREGGLRQEIENKIQELDEFKKTQEQELATIKEQHDNTYKAIRKEVESHRDILAAAGLAEAYSEEREKYPKLVKYWNRVFLVFLLYLPLIYAAIMLLSLEKNPNEFFSINNAISSLLRSIPLTLPYIWFAIYANKRRNEYHRLEQEYAHKAILAKSYLSYKKQIENLQTDDPELLKKLMGSTIDSISYNPSQTLDKKHGDSTLLDEILNSLKEIKELLKIVKTWKK